MFCRLRGVDSERLRELKGKRETDPLHLNAPRGSGSPR